MHEVIEWMDDTHGCVTSGKYSGNLVRAGLSDGPYIDMLTSNSGWKRLDRIYIAGNEDPDILVELKNHVNRWLKFAEEKAA